MMEEFRKPYTLDSLLAIDNYIEQLRHDQTGIDVIYILKRIREAVVADKDKGRFRKYRAYRVKDFIN